MNILRFWLKRGFQSIIFNSGKNMALRAFSFIYVTEEPVVILLHKALSAPSFVSYEKQRIGSPYKIFVYTCKSGCGRKPEEYRHEYKYFWIDHCT